MRTTGCPIVFLYHLCCYLVLKYAFSEKYAHATTTIRRFTLNNEHNTLQLRADETNIRAFCEWTRPLMKTIIVLRNPRGEVVVRKDTSEDQQTDFTRDLGAVSCSGSGQYRCEVEGETEQFKMVTVLLWCPIKLEIITAPPEVTAGQEVRVVIRVTSYTNVTSCVLSRTENLQRERIGCVENGRDFAVSGSPPNLTLTLSFTEVTSQDDGQWWLWLNNGMNVTSVEAATASFHLRVVSATTPLEASTVENVTVHDVTEQHDITSVAKPNCRENSDRSNETALVVGGNVISHCDDKTNDVSLRLTWIPFGVAVLGVGCFIAVVNVIACVIIICKRGVKQSGSSSDGDTSQERMELRIIGPYRDCEADYWRHEIAHDSPHSH